MTVYYMCVCKHMNVPQTEVSGLQNGPLFGPPQLTPTTFLLRNDVLPVWEGQQRIATFFILILYIFGRCII